MPPSRPPPAACRWPEATDSHPCGCDAEARSRRTTLSVSEEPRETRAPSSEDDGPLTVRDDQLPEDLQPREDNPLAQAAGDDVPDDLLQQEAAHAGSDGDSEDATSGGDDASGTSSGTASSESQDDSPDSASG